MNHYVDGFVFPISQDSLKDYKRLVVAVADIWKEHGAREYREYISDDLLFEGTRSFTDLTTATESEAHCVWMDRI